MKMEILLNGTVPIRSSIKAIDEGEVSIPGQNARLSGLRKPPFRFIGNRCSGTGNRGYSSLILYLYVNDVNTV